jgi:hypothetical protein
VEPVKLHFHRDLNDQTCEMADETLPRRVTRASTVAKALNLFPGDPFKWSQQNVDRLYSSGLFKQMALRRTNVNASDNSVQIHLDVVEKDSYVSFEPGVKANIGDGTLSGDISIRHDNLFGLNQKLGLFAKFGSKSKHPECSLRFEDDRFGREGAVRCELFQALGRQEGKKEVATSVTCVSGPQFPLDAVRSVRRGITWKVRLSSLSSGSTWMGAKMEVISRDQNNKLDTSSEGTERIKSVHIVNKGKFQFLESFYSAEAVAGASLSPAEHERKFFSSLWTFSGEIPHHGGKSKHNQIGSLKINTFGIVQSRHLPSHERHHVRVRGVDNNDEASLGWVGASLEFHASRNGTDITPIAFVDGAQSIHSFGRTLGSNVGSFGAGVLLGPLRFEVVRHQAKNQVLVGLR